MESFDLIIIGSGPAGYTAATHALDFKKNVCIIEENHFGGAGIMNGALTSKAMWEISKDYSVAAAVDRGYRANGLVIDYTEMRKSVIQAARFKQFQMLSQVETFSPIRSKEGSFLSNFKCSRKWKRFRRFVPKKAVWFLWKDVQNFLTEKLLRLQKKTAQYNFFTENIF